MRTVTPVVAGVGIVVGVDEGVVAVVEAGGMPMVVVVARGGAESHICGPLDAAPTCNAELILLELDPEIFAPDVVDPWTELLPA